MNTLKKLFPFSAFTALIITFSSCDYIEAPYTEINEVDTVLCPPLDFEAVTSHIKKVLVEDYTGHTCGNCPRAAETAHALINTYGEQVVVMAVHVGFFAQPKNNPDGSYAADYRTEYGNELNTFFGNDAAGLPNGMINRKPSGGSSPILSYNAWTGVVAAEVALAPVADIYIKPQYDEVANTACADIKVEFLSDLSGEYKLCVYLTEDSIVNWQKDYDATPSDIPNYVHRHMVRTSFNGTWGETVGASPVTSGSSEIKRYSITLNNSWESEHLHIVAFVYNASTYEVIQAEEVSLQ
ncbi:MAG: Omp28 family outer membrane lipoprotein [Bacteroidia bacterium]